MKIAIAGKMGSGKSYLSDYIIHNYKFERTSFAKKVKELAVELFNMKNKNRALLINFATKMRSIDENVWINAMMKDSKSFYNIVLDDLRLSNEYETLKNEGWFLIKVKVDEKIRLNRLKMKYGDEFLNHIKFSDSITENDVANYNDDKFDLVLDSYDNNCYEYLLEQIKLKLALEKIEKYSCKI